MNPIWRMVTIVFFITALFAGAAVAQDLVVYPAGGEKPTNRWRRRNSN